MHAAVFKYKRLNLVSVLYFFYQYVKDYKYAYVGLNYMHVRDS